MRVRSPQHGYKLSYTPKGPLNVSYLLCHVISNDASRIKYISLGFFERLGL